MTIFSAILGIILIVAIISWIIGYNALIKYWNWVEEAWKDIEIQLKRRVDLIPSFIDVVQPYARQEQQMLEKLVEIRSRLISQHADRSDMIAASVEINQILKQTYLISEDNLELKENEEYQSLKEQFSASDKKLSNAVRVYDNTVEKYNMKIQIAPTSFVAGMHGFYKRNTLGEAITQEG